jgi:hypothetical protein
MSKSEKLGYIVFMLLCASVFGFLVTREAPSPVLGQVYGVPAFVDLVDATSGTSTLAAFGGILHTITFGTMGASNILTVYDSNTSTAPSVVMVKVTTASTAPAPFTLTFDSKFANGLTVNQTVTSTITFDYQQN